MSTNVSGLHMGWSSCLAADHVVGGLGQHGSCPMPDCWWSPDRAWLILIHICRALLSVAR